jgi:hypothetical protein
LLGFVNAQNSQPSAGQNAHNADLRVVLTGDGEWRGTFADWVKTNEESFSISEIQEAADALTKDGFHVMNMGAGGIFVLRVESEVEKREPMLLAALNNLQANPNDPRAHRQALDAIKKAGGVL